MEEIYRANFDLLVKKMPDRTSDWLRRRDGNRLQTGVRLTRLWLLLTTVAAWAWFTCQHRRRHDGSYSFSFSDFHTSSFYLIIQLQRNDKWSVFWLMDGWHTITVNSGANKYSSVHKLNHRKQAGWLWFLSSRHSARQVLKITAWNKSCLIVI